MRTKGLSDRNRAARENGFLDPGMSMITKPFAIDALATRIRGMIEAN